MDTPTNDTLGTVPRPAEAGEAVVEQLAHRRLRERLFGARSEAVSIGRYRVLHKLGSGGNGVVYAAYDDRLERKVALKVLRPDAKSRWENGQRRLLAEAKALAKLAHPNIVTVFEVFVDDANDIVVAMEFVQGQTLQAWLKQTKPSVAEILIAYRAAGEGLAAAHAAGLVHRDFKPQNALVGSDGRVRVLDFGLVRMSDGLSSVVMGGSGTLDERGHNGPVRTGVVGTPAYMSPEQHRGEAADPRSDQYSFCVALWEALVGSLPFSAPDHNALYSAKLSSDLSFPRRVRVPGKIRAALLQGLRPRPRDRFDSMEQLLDGLRVRSWRRGVGFAAAGVAVAAALGAGYQVSKSRVHCWQAGGAVHELWNEESRSRLAERFEDSALSYAAASWSTTDSTASTWAHNWEQASQDACWAHQRGEQSSTMLDLRSVCLGRQLAEFKALVSVLEQADDKTVAASVRASQRLPRPEVCAQVAVEALAVDAQSGTASQPDVAAAETSVIQARALLVTGHYDKARQEAQAALDRLADASVAAVGVRAAAMIVHGDAVSRAGQPRPGVEEIRSGVILAQSVGAQEAFVRGATALIWEFGDSRSDYDVAHTWADLASAMLDPKALPQVAAQFHNNLAVVYANQQRFDDAVAQHEARLALVGRDSSAAMSTLANLGNIYNLQGRWSQALALYERAIELGSDELGDTHPSVLGVRGTMLGVLWRTGSPHEALAFGENLLGDQRATLGNDHPDLVATASNLSTIALVVDDPAAALTYATLALGQAERAFGSRSYQVVSPLLNLVRILNGFEELQTALGHAQRASTIAVASRGPEHADTAYAYAHLANTQLQLGQVEASLTSAQRAIQAGLIAHAPKSLVSWSEVLAVLALCELGRPTEAIELARSSIAHALEEENNSLEVLQARNALGQALVDAGRHREAMRELDTTIERWSVDFPEHVGAAEAEFDRARARRALGDLPRRRLSVPTLLTDEASPAVRRRVEASRR